MYQCNPKGAKNIVLKRQKVGNNNFFLKMIITKIGSEYDV